MREQYKDLVKDPSEEELKMVDMMANNQAMTAAVAGCSDELIVKNIAAKNQKDAWYNKEKSGKSSKDAPENVPAAYIGVSRTDSPSKAIRGVILYKTNMKTAPQTIEVEKVSYMCAGVNAPIIMNGNRFFLYYTYNTGAVPGAPIEDIVIDDTPIIESAATNLCYDEGGKSVYGYKDQSQFIHLVYEQPQKDFYNKLYIGRGSSEKVALRKNYYCKKRMYNG